jgi:hypothetical protein
MRALKRAALQERDEGLIVQGWVELAAACLPM